LIDYAIILLYFGFVLGIGFLLKKYMKTITDFFLSGRSIPAWIAGLLQFFLIVMGFIPRGREYERVVGRCATGLWTGDAGPHSTSAETVARSRRTIASNR
jgi:SSS family solute:Na+ symporter